MARTRAFAALITPEDLCGEAAVPGSWDDEGQRTHPGGQGPDTAPVAVALPVFGAFMGLGFEMLGHLNLKDLVEDRLDQFGQGLFVSQKPWQEFLGYVNLVVGRGFLLAGELVDLVDLTNLLEEGVPCPIQARPERVPCPWPLAFAFLHQFSDLIASWKMGSLGIYDPVTK